MTQDSNEPSLGLATTKQLLDEIQTRIMIDYYRGGGGLGYRTVEDRDDHRAVIQLLFGGEDKPVDPALVKMLQMMGGAWGPLGVAREAVLLVWPDLRPKEVLIVADPMSGSDV